jgi:hypothetical protein
VAQNASQSKMNERNISRGQNNCDRQQQKLAQKVISRE